MNKGTDPEVEKQTDALWARMEDYSKLFSKAKVFHGKRESPPVKDVSYLVLR